MEDINKKTATAAVLLIVGISIGPVGYALLDNSGASLSGLDMPMGVGQWSGPANPNTDWKPIFIGANWEGFVEYSNHNYSVFVYVATYSKQKQGVELVNAQNRLYDKDTWLHKGEGQHQIIRPDGKTLTVNMNIIGSEKKKMLLWQWYQIGEFSTSSPLVVKLYDIYTSIFQPDSMRTAVILAMEIDDIVMQEKDVLEHFVVEMIPVINKSIHM